MAHIALTTELNRSLGEGKIFLLNPHDDLIEGGHGLGNGPRILGEGDIGIAILFAGIVEMGLADLVAGALLDQMGVDL